MNKRNWLTILIHKYIRHPFIDRGCYRQQCPFCGEGFDLWEDIGGTFYESTGGGTNPNCTCHFYLRQPEWRLG